MNMNRDMKPAPEYARQFYERIKSRRTKVLELYQQHPDIGSLLQRHFQNAIVTTEPSTGEAKKFLDALATNNMDGAREIYVANEFSVSEFLREHYLDVVNYFSDVVREGDKETVKTLYKEYTEVWSYFNMGKLVAATAKGLLKDENIETSKAKSRKALIKKMYEGW